MASLSTPVDTSFQLTDVGAPIFRQYGPTAVVTAVVEYPDKRRARYTEVWTKEHGQWQAHLGHYNQVSAADSTR